MDKIFAFGEERKVWVNEGYEKFMIPAKYSDNGKRKTAKVHRFVYEQAFGPIPKGFDIHHKDENKLNNNLDNLEMISHGGHLSLHKTGNKAAYKGGSVCWNKVNQKWVAQSYQDGKRKGLGYFLSQSQAYQALFDFHPEFWTPEKREEALTRCE